MINAEPLTGFRAVLFDLDDTLYRAADFEYQADVAVAEFLAGMTGLDPERIRCEAEEARRSGWSGYLDRWVAALELPASAVLDALEVRRRLEPVLNLRPRAGDLLDGLVADGISIGVVTNGDRRQQAHKVVSLELIERYGMHVEYAADSAPKPEPVALERALGALAVEPAEAVFVGDAESDRRCAAAADVRFVSAAEVFGPLTP